jgi:hypothetical protein
MEHHAIDGILDDLGPLPDASASNGDSFDMPSFLAKHGIRHHEGRTDGNWTKYILDQCPFDPSHYAPDSFVAITARGAQVFKCSHNSCANYKWQDFRNRFEPGYK